MDGLKQVNDLSPELAKQAFYKCCASAKWADEMVLSRPYPTPADMVKNADRIWFSLERKDWLEAFQGHPKIGDNESVRAKFANTRHWASQEQSGIGAATEEVMKSLSAGNQEYEKKFGYIFIVCATGKNAKEMLAILESRIGNSPDDEIRIAASEQAKITRLRLEKLINV